MSQEPNFQLTAVEEKLLTQIDFELDGDARRSLDAAGQLTQLLLKRKAIPEIRLRYFTDPELNIGSNRSRQQVFEGNGTRGTDILFHGNFVKYLQYFLFGPDLPEATLTAFRQRVKESGGFVSGSDWPDLDGIVRQSIREHRLDPSAAADIVDAFGRYTGHVEFPADQTRSASHLHDTAADMAVECGAGEGR